MLLFCVNAMMALMFNIYKSLKAGVSETLANTILASYLYKSVVLSM